MRSVLEYDSRVGCTCARTTALAPGESAPFSSHVSGDCRYGYPGLAFPLALIPFRSTASVENVMFPAVDCCSATTTFRSGCRPVRDSRSRRLRGRGPPARQTPSSAQPCGPRPSFRAGRAGTLLRGAGRLRASRGSPAEHCSGPPRTGQTLDAPGCASLSSRSATPTLSTFPHPFLSPCFPPESRSHPRW
eukprot:scaffold561_cov254-Pinguiococcus_pyrenoidosus.AAC.4